MRSCRLLRGLEALQGKVAAQAGPIQTGLQSLQDSVGARFQAVNKKLTTHSKEHERWRASRSNKYRRREQSLRGFVRRWSAFVFPHGGTEDERTNPPIKQREEGETMPDFAPTSRRGMSKLSRSGNLDEVLPMWVTFVQRGPKYCGCEGFSRERLYTDEDGRAARPGDDQ